MEEEAGNTACCKGGTFAIRGPNNENPMCAVENYDETLMRAAKCDKGHEIICIPINQDKNDDIDKDDGISGTRGEMTSRTTRQRMEDDDNDDNCGQPQGWVTTTEDTTISHIGNGEE